MKNVNQDASSLNLFNRVEFDYRISCGEGIENRCWHRERLVRNKKGHTQLSYVLAAAARLCLHCAVSIKGQRPQKTFSLQPLPTKIMVPKYIIYVADVI